MESRQVKRAAARIEAKVKAAADRVRDRIAKRKAKGLTPLAKADTGGYPKVKLRGVRATGNVYAPNGAREVARRLRQAEGRSNG